MHAFKRVLNFFGRKKKGHVLPIPSRGAAPARTPFTGSTEALYKWRVGTN